MLVMLSNSVINAEFKKKKRACKSIDFRKKNKNLFTSWIRTHDLNASQFMAVVFNGMFLEFSPLLRLQPAAEHNLITA